MDTELIERLIIAQERTAAALEKIAAGVAKMTAGKAASAAISKPAAGGGKKKETKVVKGVVISYKEANGWHKAEVEQENGKKIWVATKIDRFVEPVQHSYTTGREVEIEYSTSQNGNYTNHYIEEVLLLETIGTRATSPADDDDVPF